VVSDSPSQVHLRTCGALRTSHIVDAHGFPPNGTWTETDRGEDEATLAQVPPIERAISVAQL
jgi:hypothetical protein